MTRFTLERMDLLRLLPGGELVGAVQSQAPLPLSLTCRLHGHHLDIADVKRGYVTEFEAKQGWTKQKPG